MVRAWKTARKRSEPMGTPALSGLEQSEALVSLVSRLEKKNEKFSHIFYLLRFSREGRDPALKFADELEKLVIEELKLLAADEATLVNRKCGGWRSDQ